MIGVEMRAAPPVHTFVPGENMVVFGIATESALDSTVSIKPTGI